MSSAEILTEICAALPDPSACNREIVEVVRVHLLPRSDIEFDTLEGAAICVPLSIAGLADVYAASFEDYRQRRGGCFVPVLVEHSGPAVGQVVKFEASDRGVDALLGLYAEGLESRKGRDFVSGFFEFLDIRSNGAAGVALVQEVSLTPTPQFALAQEPLVRISNQTSTQIAASICAAAYLPPSTPMTPEEIFEAVEPMISELIRQMIAEAVDRAEEVAVEEAGAELAEVAEEVAEEIAAADGEVIINDEDGEIMAAVAAALAPIAAQVADIDRRTKVAASLRGQVVQPSAPNAPAAGLTYIADQISAGFSLDEALTRNKEAIANGGR